MHGSIPMLQFVPPSEITEEDFAMLERSDRAGPAFDSIPRERMTQMLQEGHLHLYHILPGPGVCALEIRTGSSGVKRLTIVRFAAGPGFGWSFLGITQALLFAARDYGCEGLDTLVYDGRLAQAMRREGGIPEAVRMFLPAEPMEAHHGQRERNEDNRELYADQYANWMGQPRNGEHRGADQPAPARNEEPPLHG